MPYPTLFATPGVKAFAEAVDTERQAQLRKWGEQHHPDGTGGQQWRDAANHVRGEVDDAARAGRTTWNGILREEVFEALAESDPEKLRTELVQCGAVIAAWIADLDSRPAEGAECPAGLMPLDDGDVERCVVRGRHFAHLTASGQPWNADTEAGAW